MTENTSKLIQNKLHVAVTGCAGYIGSILCRELLIRGFKVKALDNLMFGGESIANLFNHPNFEFCRGDVRKTKDIDNLVTNNISAIIHLAAIVGDLSCQKNEILAKQVNFEATVRLAEIAKKRGIKLFIFPSSCSVYGISNPNEYVNENHQPHPVSYYAETKLECENVLVNLTDSRFNPVIFRIATAYGVSGRTRFDLLINSWTFEALKNCVISVYSPNVWRPFIHIVDIANILIKCLSMPIEKISGEIFNAGSTEENYQKIDIAEIICKIIPQTEIIFDNNFRDNRTYKVDFNKIKKIFNFNNSYTINLGILELAKAISLGLLTVENYERNRSNIE
ncbi:MAG: NAD-dependent epimerase/dehydratase family protein [Candidatus Hodarchaeota archaeon]